MVKKLLLLLGFLGVTFGYKAGASLSIANSTLAQNSPYLGIFAVSYLQGLEFGSFGINTSLGGFSADVNLSNVTLTDPAFNFFQSSLSLKEPNLLFLDIKDFKANITCYLEGEIAEPIGNISGNAALEISQTSMSLGIIVHQGKDQAIALDFADLSFTLGEAKLEFPANPFFAAIVSSQIPALLNQTTLEQLLRSFLPTINELLYGINYLPLNLLGGEFLFDLRLASNGSIEDSFFNLGLKADILNGKTQQPFTPYEPSELPKLTSMSQPLQLIVSDYVVNSLLDGVKLPISSLPDSLPLELTTNGLAFLIPQLQVKYGTNKPVRLVISANTEENPPKVHNDETLHLKGTIQVEFQVKFEEDWRHAFDLELDINGSIGLALGTQNGNLTISLDIDELTVLEAYGTHSDIGKINLVEMKSFLQQVINMVLPELNNSKINTEMPQIPLISIQNISSYIGEGFFALGITPEVSP